jgi:hypothetical protein
LRVIVVDTVEFPGVTVAGEKLHEYPCSTPVQLNVTGDGNPFEFKGAIVTVAVPLEPDIEDGDT